MVVSRDSPRAPPTAAQAKNYYAGKAQPVVNSRWTRPTSAVPTPSAKSRTPFRPGKSGKMSKRKTMRPGSAPSCAYVKPESHDDDEWWKPEWLKQPSRWRPERKLSKAEYQAHIDRLTGKKSYMSTNRPQSAMTASAPAGASNDTAGRPQSAMPSRSPKSAGGAPLFTLNENFGPSRWRKETPLNQDDYEEMISRLTKVSEIPKKPPIKATRVVYEWNSDIMKHEARRVPAKKYSPEEYTSNIIACAKKWDEDYSSMHKRLEEKWLKPIITGKKVSGKHYADVVSRLSQGMPSVEGPHWKPVKAK